MKLPRVYPIVDSAAWVRRLAPTGVKLVQLRIKDTAAGRITTEVAAARECCAAEGIQLIVNDHWRSPSMPAVTSCTWGRVTLPTRT